MPYVFISYSRKDRAYVDRLTPEFERWGIPYWMDERLVPSDEWWRTIEERLRGAGAFLVVMTPDSAESDWVHRECLLALEHGKPIFPLLLKSPRFGLFVDVQYEDVQSGRLPGEVLWRRLRGVLHVSTARQPFEPEMVHVPAGEFLMGSDPQRDSLTTETEQPQHSLHLSGFLIARTPITLAQYADFVRSTRHRTPWGRGRPPEDRLDHPVVEVDWHDAGAYCTWLSEATGRNYRLPSEAEWEKAARGTEGRIYPWGDEPPTPELCNFGRNVKSITPVGRYSPGGDSPYGCADMAGNVWEWTCSVFRTYPYDPEDGRQDLGAEARRTLRGGAFDNHVGIVRCAYRHRDIPELRDYNIGFRVVVPTASGL